MSDKQGLIVLTFLVSIIICFLFRDVVWYPNSYLFGTEFDGVKNYYTFIYYILYDQGIYLSGMNYPFGEHISFTDNQPLFSYPLRLINQYCCDISGIIVGIFNYIILLSILLGALVLYKILRKCLLPPWYSMLTATIVVFFAQQNNMFGPYYGAYALSYSWVIPLQWLIIIKTYEERTKYRWFLIGSFLLFLIGFIHPYYYLFGFLLVIFHLLAFILFNFSKYRELTIFTGLQIFLAVSPLIAFKVFLLISDPVTDRPETPFGLNDFRGRFADIFYSSNSLMANYLEPMFKFKGMAVSHGYGYIGITGIGCWLLAIFKIINYSRKKNYKLIYKPVLPGPLLMAIWPGIAIVLFALGFPFRLYLEFLYDLFPVIKQFRVLSRFLWAFYYIFSVYAAFCLYQLYRFLRINGYTKIALGFITFFLMSWAIDAKINISETAFLVRQNKVAESLLGGKFNYKHILQSKGYNAQDFQAILPFPYFTAGSEKITIQPYTAMPIAMSASIQTGLPLINGMLSRTSLQQSFKSIQLVSNTFIDKDIIQELPSKKPLLLLVAGDKLHYYEKNLILKGKLIYKNAEVALYSLPLMAFAATAKTEALAYFKIHKSKLFQKGFIYRAEPKENFVFSTFYQYLSDKWLFDKGALTAKKGPVIIYNEQIPNTRELKEPYRCSVWINLNTKSPLGILAYNQFDANGKLVDHKKVDVSSCVEIYKDWVNVSFKFILQNPQNKIRLEVTGDNIIVDELLILPSKLNIYYLTTNQDVIYNNFLIH